MLEADLLIDRRRLKRRLNFWRVAAVLAVVAALCAWFVRDGIGSSGQHIARVNVTGIITDDRKLQEAVLRLAKDGSVPAVIVAVDSPGGSVSGGATLHDALRRVAAVKPVVAVMRGTAASAGYMISLSAERIFAHNATLTGSIGVIMETGNVAGLLDKLGIEVTPLASGPLKDQPNFFKPLSPEGRTYLNGLVQDLYEQFVAMVAQSRHMDVDVVRKLADGRAYTGRQAKELGLVDEIGGEFEARAWLAEQHGVSADMPIRDLKPSSFLERTVGASMTGLRTLLLGGTRPGAWALWLGT